MSASSSHTNIPVTQLKGVGPRIAEHLRKINIINIEDVLLEYGCDLELFLLRKGKGEQENNCILVYMGCAQLS